MNAFNGFERADCVQATSRRYSSEYMPSSRGGDRRVAALVDALRPHLPQPGVLRVPASARAGAPGRPPARASARAARWSSSRGPTTRRIGSPTTSSRWVGGRTSARLPGAGCAAPRARPPRARRVRRTALASWPRSIAARHRVTVGSLLAFVQRTARRRSSCAAARPRSGSGERIGAARRCSSGSSPAATTRASRSPASASSRIVAGSSTCGRRGRRIRSGSSCSATRSSRSAAFDPMTQALAPAPRPRRSSCPHRSSCPLDGWDAATSARPTAASDQLREDAAHLAQGDLAEAAETWAALLTAGPAADHVPTTAHLVLTDTDELHALAADLDTPGGRPSRRASWPRASCRLDWPLPYDALRHARRSLRDRAAEALEEQADLDAGYGSAPTAAGPRRAGRRVADRARGTDGRRVVVTTDQASRVGELLDEAGRPVAPVAELREAPAAGSIGLVHGSLSGGFAHAAERAAGGDRPRAVRRDARAAAGRRRSAWSRATSSASSRPATTSSTSTMASRGTPA